jgi:hypothetical protein
MKKIREMNLLVIFVLLVSGSFVSCKKPVTVKPLSPTLKQEEVKVDPASENIRYEVIKKTNQLRKDGGTTYYIIIRPLDLSDDAFVSKIKDLIKKIVKTDEKNENITIEIFDSLNALDWLVSKQSISSPLLQSHYVAKYVGLSDEEIYKNTLYLYPSATKDTPVVKEYFDIIDFDPSTW